MIHIHQPVEQSFVCVDCQNHIKHNGHISSDTFTLHECVLCEFLSTVYTSASAIEFSVFLLVVSFCCIKREQFVQQLVCGNSNPRAPPSF